MEWCTRDDDDDDDEDDDDDDDDDAADTDDFDWFLFTCLSRWRRLANQERHCWAVILPSVIKRFLSGERGYGSSKLALYLEIKSIDTKKQRTETISLFIYHSCINLTAWSGNLW